MEDEPEASNTTLKEESLTLAETADCKNVEEAKTSDNIFSAESVHSEESDARPTVGVRSEESDAHPTVDVLQSDRQWGHKILHQFLSSIGFETA